MFRISIHNSCYDLIQTTKLYYCIITIIKRNQPSYYIRVILNATVNHLRSTSTYTSYFILLLLVTKYYKSAVYVGGDSVKSDQTYILISEHLFHQLLQKFSKIQKKSKNGKIFQIVSWVTKENILTEPSCFALQIFLNLKTKKILFSQYYKTVVYSVIISFQVRTFRNVRWPDGVEEFIKISE